MQLIIAHAEYLVRLRTGQRQWLPTADGAWRSRPGNMEDFLARFNPTEQKAIKVAASIRNLDAVLRQERARERLKARKPR